MLFDGSMHQLPDTDPSETQEWLDSLDSVINVHGKVRARYLLSRLLEKAQQSQVSFPATVSTPYVNTIPRDHEPWFPGDEHIERRIRAFIRWNAAAMQRSICPAGRVMTQCRFVIACRSPCCSCVVAAASVIGRL